MASNNTTIRCPQCRNYFLVKHCIGGKTCTWLRCPGSYCLKAWDPRSGRTFLYTTSGMGTYVNYIFDNDGKEPPTDA